MTTVSVATGDITTMPAAALIAPMDASRSTDGAVDQAIIKLAGTRFHDQTNLPQGLQYGDVIQANAKPEWNTPFRSVLFVVDNLQESLYNVVTNALRAANHYRLATVTLPLFRTGTMRGIYESEETAHDHMMRGIGQFILMDPPNVSEVTLVVYDNEALADELRRRVQGMMAIQNTQF